jgi:hypothetical protein
MTNRTWSLALALLLAATPAFGQRAGGAAGIGGAGITPNAGIRSAAPNTGVVIPNTAVGVIPNTGVGATPNTGVGVIPNTGVSRGAASTAPSGETTEGVGTIVGNTGGDTGVRTTPGFGTGVAAGVEAGISGGTIVGNMGSDTGLRSTLSGTTDINGNGIGAAPSTPPGMPLGVGGTVGAPTK